jgi:hypothetical protein
MIKMAAAGRRTPCLVTILPLLPLLSSKFLPRCGLVGQAPPKEKRAFIQRIPEDGSGSALTPFLRNLNIYN